MKKITLLLAFMLAIVTGSYGQAGSYSFAESTEVYTPVVGTASTAAGDDGIQNLVPIGFTFNFDGVAYTDFGISTNGWIKMGTVAIGAGSWTNALGNAATHRPLIAPFWDDHNLSTGNIQYVLSGTSPNQTLEVGWDNISISNGGTASTTIFGSFKLRLYETTNVIEFVYGPTIASAGTITASVGINGASSFLSVTPAATSTASSATANNGINTAANVVGKKYTFTPPPACSGAPVGGIVAPAVLNLCVGNTIGNLVASGFTTGVSGITFQWEESPDGTTWGNAVGGTGATTTTYTPPVYSGTPIQYRLNVTCTNSGSSGASAASVIGNQGTPVVQVSNAIGTNLQLLAATVNWTNGNGGRRLVILSDTSSITDPTDGNAAALVANTVYAGTGQQIMYDGTASTVAITGLTQNTTYYGKVYEYLRCGTDPYDYYYNVSSGTNVFTFTTPVPPVNDDCSAALPLTVGVNFAANPVGGTILGAATTAGVTPSCQASFGSDVWYTVTVPASGNLIIETQVAPANSMGDSVVAAFTGACGTLTQIGCDDDGGLAGPNNLMSILTLTGRTPGEVLYIGVWKWQPALSNSSTSQFLLSAYDCPSTLPAPTGDDGQTFCNSGTVADLVATGTAIKWYDAETLGNLLLSTDALVSGNIYYASQTDGCEGLSRLAVTVTITATPADPTGAAAQTFCSTGSPDLTTLAVASGGTGIVWYDAATLGNVLPDTTVLTATTYYAASVDGTCESTGRLAITTTEDCPAESCLNDDFGQYPGAAFVPDNASCDGITAQEIVDDGWASEYSMVTVVSGETYIFASSITTDIITIGAEDGTSAFTSGVGSVTWVATISGDVRFYTHLTGCDAEIASRARLVTCGTPSNDLPDYVNLQFPSTLNFTQGGSGTVYGQVYEGGLTDVIPNITGQAPGITAWVGVSPEGSNTNPNTWTDWTPATWNAAHVSNNDEYQATIGAALDPGTYYYATRFRLNSGAYVYGGIDGAGNGNFWNGTTHNSGVLTVTPPPAPANDECAAATLLVVDDTFCNGTNTNGTNLGATDSLVATASCFNFGENDVWFSFVAPLDTATIDVSTDFLGGTLYDTEIALYSGACGTLLEMNCSQDQGTTIQPNGFSWNSLITNATVVAGDTYYVRVSGYDETSTGTFCLRVSRNTLSNEAFNTSNFSYYPNPVKNILNLSYTQNISSVAVFNLLGQQVVSKLVNANQSQIDMSELPTGAYLVKVTADNQIKTIKVIKE